MQLTADQKIHHVDRAVFNLQEKVKTLETELEKQDERITRLGKQVAQYLGDGI